MNKDDIIEKARFILDNTGDEPEVDIGPDDAHALAEMIIEFFQEDPCEGLK